jgi:hypothetical protein
MDGGGFFKAADKSRAEAEYSLGSASGADEENIYAMATPASANETTAAPAASDPPAGEVVYDMASVPAQKAAPKAPPKTEAEPCVYDIASTAAAPKKTEAEPCVYDIASTPAVEQPDYDVASSAAAEEGTE